MSRSPFATHQGYAAMVDPEMHTIYENMAAKENKRPYCMAFSDYFKGKDLIAKK